MRMLFVFVILLSRLRLRARHASENSIRLEEEETDVALPPRYSADEKGVLLAAETPSPEYSMEKTEAKA